MSNHLEDDQKTNWSVFLLKSYFQFQRRQNFEANMDLFDKDRGDAWMA